MSYFLKKAHETRKQGPVHQPARARGPQGPRQPLPSCLSVCFWEANERLEKRNVSSSSFLRKGFDQHLMSWDLTLLVSLCSWQVLGHPRTIMGHCTLQMNVSTFSGGKERPLSLLSHEGSEAPCSSHGLFLFVVGI